MGWAELTFILWMKYFPPPLENPYRSSLSQTPSLSSSTMALTLETPPEACCILF